ncbi:uncharacterized protein BXZ73DRAFT_104699 [Epithele typhae]|uniref:uncharacterized protein n=1 Tax=Epithele typhae TaxID=378194 RepID=UPI0020085D62|nr:uncharacterized protein BXZ73DRAFT_104699 [Epithele typhae]KAH9920572.1 hypothetical protein BXZ73DRAFT_104699 [Epithele typhae]
MARTFPSELYHAILLDVSREDQRTCLFASRHLHDIALAQLFRHITISFGTWEDEEQEEEKGEKGSESAVEAALRAIGVGLISFSLVAWQPNLTKVLDTLAVHNHNLFSLNLTYDSLEMEPLSSLLSHCNQLRELALFLNLKSSFRDDLSTVLRPGQQPFLSSFKLFLGLKKKRTEPHPPWEEMFQTVSAYLANRPTLRRLLVSPTNMNSQTAVTRQGCVPTCSIIELLPSLPGLEVFSYHQPHYVTGQFTEPDVKRLDEKLPLGITAFALQMKVDKATQKGIDAFVEMVLRRRRLQYLHVVITKYQYMMNGPYRRAPLELMRKRLLENPPPSLELLGDHDLFLDVSAPRLEPHNEPECWSEDKVWSRTIDDYGNADWFWLTGDGELPGYAPGP